MKYRVKTALLSLLKFRAIILGIALLNFMLSLMYMRQVELESQARMREGIWPYPHHWNALAVMREPSLLLVASVFLLLGRWWSNLLAILASGRVIYTHGYSSWVAVSAAHDVPMFRRQALEKLWHVVYEPRLQYFFEFALSAVVFIYAASPLWNIVYRKWRG